MRLFSLTVEVFLLTACPFTHGGEAVSKKKDQLQRPNGKTVTPPCIGITGKLGFRIFEW